MRKRILLLVAAVAAVSLLAAACGDDGGSSSSSSGKKVGQFFWVHEMHCVSENEIYTGEAQNWRVQRITMKK